MIGVGLLVDAGGGSGKKRSKGGGQGRGLERLLVELGCDPGRMPRRGMVSCPLHDDKSPSCSIDLDKGVWHCFSCGEGGDVYTLAQVVYGVDFLAASEMLVSSGVVAGGAAHTGFRHRQEPSGRFASGPAVAAAGGRFC